MIYKVLINEEYYKFKEMGDFTFFQNEQLLEAIEDNDYEQLFDLFLDVKENRKHIPKDVFFKIPWDEIINSEMKIRDLQKSYLGNDRIDLNKITVGRFIDLDYILTSEDVDDKLPQLTAYLISPDNYSTTSIEKLVKEIKEKLKLKDVIALINVYVDFRNNIMEKYSRIYQKNEANEIDDGEEVEEKKKGPEFGLLGIIYSIIGYRDTDEVLEKGILSFLNYLNWYIYDQERQKKEMKKNGSK